MPSLISVNEFVDETRDDYNSPTTSTFVSRMPQCRQTIASLEETLDYDRDGLTKMRKAIKAIHNSGNSHVDNEMYFSRVLERLGGSALSKDQEPDIGAAFIKFAVVTKELSALMKTLMQNINNIVMFPLESLLKGDLRGTRGELKRPFDKACKDYETKYIKIEKEKKQQAKEAGLIRTEVTAAEIADDMEKERRLFQLQMCEYLIKVNEIKTKKGLELLQHLVEYYHAQTNYFQDGLKTIEHFGNYIADLSIKLQQIRQKQDDERKRLAELRNVLRSAPGFEKEVSGHTPEKGTGYSLHQLQGDKGAGMTRSGYLLKKSEGKMRRVWQKRRCSVQSEGFLDIFHADESKSPTRVNLLTCQIKVVHDDKRCFDLVSYNRTYHFQAEDEPDLRGWLSVLVNCKEGALYRAFDNEGGRAPGSSSLLDLQQAIIRHVQRLPSNDRCCDCNSVNDATWLCTNFGVVICIECSGIHRDLGVHISRIQSLTLDNIGTSQLLLARYMTNQGFNDIMEATLHASNKLTSSSTMEERYEFIRAKYVDKKFSIRSCTDEKDLLSDLEHAVNNKNLYNLLQVFAEGVDFSAPLPSSDCGETALHLAIKREMGSSLHLVDFLIQNMPTSGLDKRTNNINGGGSNTALHLCAIHDKPECMKLLLRSGADPSLHNALEKTPLEIAQEKGHKTCEDLLRSAMQKQKISFDNVNVEWNLVHDDGSTDFSDDETTLDDKNGCVTPERKQASSRPPSYMDSPRNRSSTCDSFGKLCSSYRSSISAALQSKRPSLPQPVISSNSNNNSNSNLKKRAAPLPPPSTSSQQQFSYGTLPSQNGRNSSTTISSSDSQSYNFFGTHKRTPSNDSSNTIHLVGARLVIPPGEIPTLKSISSDNKPGGYHVNTVQRPRCPPPPAPPQGGSLVNGQSTESIYSISSSNQDTMSSFGGSGISRRKQSADSFEEKTSTPVVSGMEISRPMPMNRSSLARCRALYDCSADNEDELSFSEGDTIIITNMTTEDENWMEGCLERNPSSKGMFPISFVHMLPDG